MRWSPRHAHLSWPRRRARFVPPPRFELLAERFFAESESSVEGWERAIDAQRRIATGLADLLDAPADVAVIGHGAVGTLWYCTLTGQAIARRHDQPGQGHYFTVDCATRQVLHPWRPIDVIESGPLPG